MGLGSRVSSWSPSCSLYRESQVELREHIDSLATGETWWGSHLRSPAVGAQRGFAPHVLGVCGSLGSLPASALSPELCRINEDQKVALDLDPYVKKLLNARRRVVLVNNILQNAQVSAGTLGGWGPVFWGP